MHAPRCAAPHLLHHVIHLAQAVEVLRRVLSHARRQLRQLRLQACREHGRGSVKNVRARHARQGRLLHQRGVLLVVLVLVLVRRRRWGQRQGQRSARAVQAAAPAAGGGQGIGSQRSARRWGTGVPVVHLRSGSRARGALLLRRGRRRKGCLPHVLGGGRVA